MLKTQSAGEPAAATSVAQYDAVVVGAGFAGMYTLHRLRQAGLSVRVIEAAPQVGGTWFWNCYPGARVDVESLSYSYSFSPELQQEWSWKQAYAPQAELLEYADHVAQRFDLHRDIQFETRVVSTTYSAELDRWTVRTDRGDRITTTYLIMAVGCLSATNVPDFPGLGSFAGSWHHTSRWPREGVDVTGKRVGVVGTGSTGIQAIPVLAEDAGHLYVFQRTPNYSLPSKNSPMDPERERDWKANYDEHRAFARMSPTGSNIGLLRDISALSVSDAERSRIYEEAWRIGGSQLLRSFNDIAVDPEANETAAEFVRAKIRQIVRDPDTAELLTPRDYPIGTKRICLDTGYYETYNRDNVTLVDVRSDPIEEITPQGLRTSAEHYPLDVLVFATGFDAMTGPLLEMEVTGRDGLALRDKWAAGPRTYLGVMTAGFPNMFMVTGPGSPSVLSNMTTSIEQHVDFIADAIEHLRASGAARIEPTVEAEDSWVEHVNEVADRTLYKRANSWYLGANIPGKPRIFMPYAGGVGTYRQVCETVVAKGYDGFALQ
ncbi:flavin-containing monooxygenase [Pseudonocardia lacus]|uniref:flavin-containing monooxygenase n=1 Tax=Pseudonocardia lacus TaxID=2835865 RepID=UPI001BDD888B|nr:NAD(P)/FAD-dependent oxidoreductase [Pseudonocardia lacus]